MIFKALSKEVRVLRALRRGFAAPPVKQQNTMPEFTQTMQFSKQRLTDFGELPRGEVPLALHFSPAFKHTRLANGAQLFTEQYPGEFATVSVFIKAGSRFETIESSGASHFLLYMMSKGSKGRARKDFQKSLDEIGAHVEITTGREIVGLTLKVNSADAGKAIELLTDAIAHPDFNENQIEADKEFVHRRILDVSRDQYEHTKEALFYTSFREHMVGQSEYGIRDNIPSLTAKQLEEFHAQNFAGPNTIFVVSGSFDEGHVNTVTQKSGQAISAEARGAAPNSEKPVFTPVVMNQRDDEMYNLNVASGFRVSEFGGRDFFALKFIEKIVSGFNAETDGNAHLNAAQMSMNYVHQVWGQRLGVTLSNSKYEAFSDFGIFTFFVHGNDFWARDLFLGNQFIISSLSKKLDMAQVYRARAEWFNDLLATHSSKKLNEDIAKELFYAGRRITRTEYANRFSNLAEPCSLQKVIKEHFFDKEVGVAMWGVGHNMAQYSYYVKKLHSATKGKSIVML